MLLSASGSTTHLILPSDIIEAAKNGTLSIGEQEYYYANLKDDLGRTLAFHALDNDHLQLATDLLSLQDEINNINAAGWSILHLIAKKDATDLLMRLQASGNISKNFLLLTNASQDTCLATAARCGSVEVLTCLLDLFKQNGITDPTIYAKALILAAHEDHADCVIKLLEYGIDLNLCNEQQKENFIHMLIRCNAQKTLEALKNKIGSSDLIKLWYNEKNNAGLTPLELAVFLHKWQIAKILLSLRTNGADTLQWLTLLKVIENEVASQQAKASGHPVINDYLPLVVQYKMHQAEVEKLGFNPESIPVEYDTDDEYAQIINPIKSYSLG